MFGRTSAGAAPGESALIFCSARSRKYCKSALRSHFSPALPRRPAPNALPSVRRRASHVVLAAVFGQKLWLSGSGLGGVVEAWQVSRLERVSSRERNAFACQPFPNV